MNVVKLVCAALFGLLLSLFAPAPAAACSGKAPHPSLRQTLAILDSEPRAAVPQGWREKAAYDDVLREFVRPYVIWIRCQHGIKIPYVACTQHGRGCWSARCVNGQFEAFDGAELYRRQQAAKAAHQQARLLNRVRQQAGRKTPVPKGSSNLITLLAKTYPKVEAMDAMGIYSHWRLCFRLEVEEPTLDPDSDKPKPVIDPFDPWRHRALGLALAVLVWVAIELTRRAVIAAARGSRPPGWAPIIDLASNPSGVVEQGTPDQPDQSPSKPKTAAEEAAEAYLKERQAGYGYVDPSVSKAIDQALDREAKSETIEGRLGHNADSVGSGGSGDSQIHLILDLEGVVAKNGTAPH